MSIFSSPRGFGDSGMGFLGHGFECLRGDSKHDAQSLLFPATRTAAVAQLDDYRSRLGEMRYLAGRAVLGKEKSR